MSTSNVFNIVYDLYNEYVEREYINRNIERAIDKHYDTIYEEYFTDCHSYLIRLLEIFFNTDFNIDNDIFNMYYDLCMMIF